MLIDINKIKVKDRIRKDFGDIEELARDIKENSLLNPITVIPLDNNEYQLIAGERRLRACKLLGMTNIIVNVITVRDAEQALRIEIAENENRKEFSFSERMEWARRLEEIESLKARERQLSNLIQNTSDTKNSSERTKMGETAEIVAKEIGLGSKDSYRKAKYIHQNADEDLIQQLDEKQISIHAAYQKLKKEKEDALQQVEQLKEEKNKITNESINKLNKQIEEKQKDYDLLLKEKVALENKMKLIEEKNEEYEKLKKNIELLSKKREDVSRQIESSINISGLVVEVDHLIKDKLAPIKWSRAIQEMHEDEIVIENLTEIINTVQTWCDEMREYLPNQRKIINVEAM